MQGAVYIGVDNNIAQCTAAYDNVVFADEMHAVHIINADVTCMFNFTVIIFCTLYILFADVVLGLGPWLSLRTKLESLVLAFALKVQSLVQALALSLESLLTSLQFSEKSLRI